MRPLRRPFIRRAAAPATLIEAAQVRVERLGVLFGVIASMAASFQMPWSQHDDVEAGQTRLDLGHEALALVPARQVRQEYLGAPAAGRPDRVRPCPGRLGLVAARVHRHVRARGAPKTRAVAAPMPLLAPVTSTRLPFRPSTSQPSRSGDLRGPPQLGERRAALARLGHAACGGRRARTARTRARRARTR